MVRIGDRLRNRLEVKGISAKRSISKGGIEAWYPYYAGFTEDFVAEAIHAARLRRGSKVFDPWNGVGTTTSTARKLGFHSVGSDINPVAVLVSGAKNANAEDARGAIGLATMIGEAALLMSEITRTGPDPLSDWLAPELVRTFRVIEFQLLCRLAAPEQVPLNPALDPLPPLVSFLLFCLLKAGRRFAGMKVGTNPTWIKPDLSASNGNPEDLVKTWLRNIELYSNDLIGRNPVPSQLYIADSRDVPLADRSIDLVVSSPPYCTRIDYVVKTSFELAALGVDQSQNNFKELRRAYMGTPLSRGSSDKLENAPVAVTKLLEMVKSHPSKASSTYYHSTYLQYFTDAMRSLTELRRVLKPRKHAILVVQTSYYKDVFVDLPLLYVEMGRSLGFAADISASFDVTRSLAQINSRSNSLRATTQHAEAVVVLETK